MDLLLCVKDKDEFPFLVLDVISTKKPVDRLRKELCLQAELTGTIQLALEIFANLYPRIKNGYYHDKEKKNLYCWIGFPIT